MTYYLHVCSTMLFINRTIPRNIPFFFSVALYIHNFHATTYSFLPSNFALKVIKLFLCTSMKACTVSAIKKRHSLKFSLAFSKRLDGFELVFQAFFAFYISSVHFVWVCMKKSKHLLIFDTTGFSTNVKNISFSYKILFNFFENRFSQKL